MRSLAWRIAAPLVVVGIACGRGGSSRESAMNADLQRDLAAASAAGVELANGTGGYRPAQVVSAIEQSETAIPVERRPVRKPVVHHHTAAPEATEKAPDPIPDVAVEAPKAPEPQQPESGASDAPTIPSVAPRPAPLPVEMPAADRGSGGRGTGADGAGPGDLGGIIGVIIRGGAVGDDHCVPHRPRSRPRGNGFPIRGTIFNPGGTIVNPSNLPQTIRGVPVLRPRGRN